MNEYNSTEVQQINELARIFFDITNKFMVETGFRFDLSDNNMEHQAWEIACCSFELTKMTQQQIQQAIVNRKYYITNKPLNRD